MSKFMDTLDYELAYEGSIKELRGVTYGVPYCPICHKPVDKIELVKGYPCSGKSTIVTSCHGQTDEFVIREQTGEPLGVPDKPFSDPKFSTLNGRDNTEQIKDKHTEFEELDGRLKHVGLEIGTKGELTPCKK